MIRPWLPLLTAACLLPAAPPRRTVRAAAVVAYATASGTEARILRFRGCAFPWVDRQGVPASTAPEEAAPGAFVACRTAKGPSRVPRAELVRYLQTQAWPPDGPQAFLGLLDATGGRWELQVADAEGDIRQAGGIPLAGLPPDLHAGRALVLGRLRTLDSIYQREEAFLDIVAWSPLD